MKKNAYLCSRNMDYFANYVIQHIFINKIHLINKIFLIMKKFFLFVAAALMSVSMFADNLTVAEAKAKIDAKDYGPYTVEGYVVKFYEAYNPSYKNISLWMADDKAAEKGDFVAYRLKIDDKIDPADIPVPGDKIAVTATLTKYSSTYETDSKKDQSFTIVEKGAGTRYTADDLVIGKVNVAEAIEAGMKLANGETGLKVYEVTGYVVSIAKNGSFNNGKMSFYMHDDATQTKGDFEAYQVKIAEAANKGDKVKVTGNLQRYDGNNGTTIEIAYGQAEIVEKAQGIEDVVLTEKAQKVMVDGVVYIVRDGKMYNALGTQVR